jgi:hypothetical protein
LGGQTSPSENEMRGSVEKVVARWGEARAKRRSERRKLGGPFGRRERTRKKLDIDEAGPKYYGIGLLVGVYLVRFGYCPSLG